MAKKDKTPVQEKESASEAIAKKFKQSPGIYIGSVIILVLITITFIGGDFLSGGGLGGSGDDWVFGYYDNIPITLVQGNMFAQFSEQIRQRAQSQGADLNDFRVNAQIWRQAFEQTVVHIAVLNLVNKSNYTVSERAVNRAVLQLPHFQSNGRFSSTLYNQMPESRRLSLWRQLQEELNKSVFFEDFNRLKIPENEARFISNMASPMRSFDMVSFNVDDYPDAEFLSFAQENASLFNSIHMSKITMTGSEREARRVLASIENGTVTFEDAARVNSQDGFSDRGGDMGTRYFFELEGDIPNSEDRNTVFNLRRGEVSGLISSGNEWVIFRIENETTLADFEDSIVMDRVRSYVRSVARGRMEDWAIAQARDFAAEAIEYGFDNVARWRNMERRSFGPVPINYAGVDLFPSLESFTISGFAAQDVSSMARNENFWKTVFSAPLNSPSEPLVQGSNVLIFVPTEEIEADVSYLENIAAMYSLYWLSFINERSLPQYFLGSDKMSSDDFFWNAYFRYLMR
jgi:hypothetical protein